MKPIVGFEAFVRSYREYLDVLNSNGDDIAIFEAQVDVRRSYSQFADVLFRDSGWSEPLMADLSDEDDDDDGEIEGPGGISSPDSKKFTVTVSVVVVEEVRLNESLLLADSTGAMIDPGGDVAQNFQAALGSWISDLHAQGVEPSFSAETESAWINDTSDGEERQVR